MAIQLRRGVYTNLDTQKLLPGEYAIVLEDDPLCKDGKSVYICFKAGDTKRMATYEDMRENIDNITEDILAVMRQATDDANEAAEYATNVGDDLLSRLANGEFNGPQGASGVVTTTQGQVAFQILDDNLYIFYHDGDPAPDCKIDENGCLIMDFGGDA